MLNIEKDLKEEEEELPEENGQPQSKTTDDSDDETGEEMVTMSKSELEKIQRDRDNYRNGLLNVKRKGRTIPESETGKKDEEEDEEDEDKFVSKKDFQKGVEKSAIKEASKEPEVDENWDSIMEFYIPRHGRATVEDIVADIELAHKVWRSENPSTTELKKKDDRKVIADLSSDAGLGKGKDKKPNQPKKSILPKQEKMDSWYGDNK